MQWLQVLDTAGALAIVAGAGLLLWRQMRKPPACAKCDVVQNQKRIQQHQPRKAVGQLRIGRKSP